MRPIMFLLILSGTAMSPAAAQRPPDHSGVERAAMERLAFLVGDWEGDATIRTRDGEMRLRQTERVRPALGGVILLVEGTGYALASDSTVGDVVFNAYAIISYEEGEGYQMRSWLRSGQEAARELVVSDSGFVWVQRFQTGSMRYTMQLTPAGEWYERGEFTQDGERYYPTMEMLLRRTAH